MHRLAEIKQTNETPTSEEEEQSASVKTEGGEKKIKGLSAAAKTFSFIYLFICASCYDCKTALVGSLPG